MIAERVLTDADELRCPHGGTVHGSFATGFSIDGHRARVVVPGAVLAVDGCPHDPPCAGATLDAAASPLTEHGLPVLLASSPGACVDAGGAAAGPVAVVAGPDGGADGGIRLL